MGLRFKVALMLLLLAAFPVVSGAEDAPQTEQNSDSLEMISQRMRSLTNSLERMPEPPAFNQKIQLPGDFLPVSKPSTSSDDEFLEKENYE